MGGSSKRVTVGYRYFMGVHIIPCFSVDSLLRIKYGERVAWSGNESANQTITIDKPNLFGGEESQGGISGSVELDFGGSGQGKSSYLTGQLGSNIPAFRQYFGLVFRKCYFGTNPFIKPLTFRVRRTDTGWEQSLDNISGNLNGVHIVREALTSVEWGLGIPDADLGTSWVAAATTAFNEGFGLSITFSQQTSVEEFISEILKHIDGSVYIDETTGKWEIKLARDDYVIGDLPVFDESNISSMDSFERTQPSEIVNEVTVVYRDRSSNKDVPVTIQNLASIEQQGGVISATNNYPGIPNASLANKVAARDLRALSTVLFTASFTTDRTAYNLKIADVFKLTWPAAGVTDLVMRVTTKELGTLEDGRIRITAIQDVFALGESSFEDPPPTGWQDPITEPEALTLQRLDEVPYYTIIKEIVGETLIGLSDIDDDDSIFAANAVRQTQTDVNFRILVRSGSVGDFSDEGPGDFTPTALLDGAITHTQTVIPIKDAVDILESDIDVDEYFYIDDEIMGVVSVSDTSVTVKRGVLDTVPATHADEARLYFAEGFQAIAENNRFTFNEDIESRLIPQNALGSLLEASATILMNTGNRRFIRPYPPGNFQINSSYFPSDPTGQIVITWAHRSRTQQTAGLNAFTEGNIGPEAGIAYRLAFFDDDTDTLIELVSLSSSVTSHTMVSSNVVGSNGDIRIELYTLRDGFESLFRQTNVFTADGFGMAFGNNFGGD